jgi:cell division protein WhiA
MAEGRSFTEAVRQELARRDLGSDRAVRAELTGLLRVAGSLQVHGGARQERRVTLELRTTSGAVARRVFTLLQRRYDLRPELLVRAPGGMHQRSTYAVRVQAVAAGVGRDLGLLDDDGRPSGTLPTGLRGPQAVAYLRGAFLAGGSLSAPGRAPHLEIGVRTPELAEALAALARSVVDGTVTATRGQRPRWSSPARPSANY